LCYNQICQFKDQKLDMLFKNRRFISFTLYLILIYPGFAQDSHYWTNQYGTDAQLLGGLVVGSTNDLSSTYYNLGAISLTLDERLILSTDAVEFIHIRINESEGGQMIPAL